MPAPLAHRLRHVYWIGGGPGAGKSTIARRLAARHALSVYSTDEAMVDHARRCKDCPALQRFAAMDMDERWVRRTPEVMVDTFHWFRGEGFGLIAEDLLALAADGSVVAEGFRLLPDLVRPLLASTGQAVWLLPTDAFRQAAIDGRAGGPKIAESTSDPARARRNLAERDRLFVARLRAETSRLGLRAIEVDTAMTEDELTGRVIEAFGL